jgi:hypothetical protein
MTEADVIWEYRQICELEAERSGGTKPPDTQSFADDSYEAELRELVSPEDLERLRGGHG